LKVITCLGVVCILDCESIPDCMMKIFLALAYPLLVWLLVCCSPTFAMIINLLMGADARGNHDQQGRDNPLHSILGLDFLCWLGFLLGQWPMYCLAFGLLFLKTLSLFLYVLFWHRGVSWLVTYCTELWLYSKTA